MRIDSADLPQRCLVVGACFKGAGSSDRRRAIQSKSLLPATVLDDSEHSRSGAVDARASSSGWVMMKTARGRATLSEASGQQAEEGRPCASAGSGCDGLERQQSVRLRVDQSNSSPARTAVRGWHARWDSCRGALALTRIAVSVRKACGGAP